MVALSKCCRQPIQQKHTRIKLRRGWEIYELPDDNQPQ